MTLRVRLEIVPHGNEDAAYEIGRLEINNMGPVEFGHSVYKVLDLGKEPGEYIETIYHRRDLGAWALVKKCLDKLQIAGPYDQER